MTKIRTTQLTLTAALACTAGAYPVYPPDSGTSTCVFVITTRGVTAIC